MNDLQERIKDLKGRVEALKDSYDEIAYKVGYNDYIYSLETTDLEDELERIKYGINDMGLIEEIDELKKELRNL